MINRFEKYDKKTNITYKELCLLASMIGNIEIYDNLMDYHCLNRNRAALESQRYQIVYKIKSFSAEKEAFIQRINDITQNGKIKFNELEEPMKSEVLALRDCIKNIREAVTYGYRMINCIKKKQRHIDVKITNILNIVKNPNLTKLAEDWKAKMEEENGKSE